MVLSRKCFALIVFCCVCGGYTTIVNWDEALPLVLVQNKADSVLGIYNPGTNTLELAVRSLFYLCVLHGYQAPNISVPFWVVDKIREDLVVKCSDWEGI